MAEDADREPAIACCRRPPPAALLRGIEQFNAREYFECHETLEDLWNLERAALRRFTAATGGAGSVTARGCDDLYKGILQVGVGCYHLLRRNYRGAQIKLQTGADYLEPFAPACMGVAVGRLIADARRLRAAVVALGPERFMEVDLALLPQVRLVAKQNEAEG